MESRRGEKQAAFSLARFETNKRQRRSLPDLSGGDGVYIICPLIVKGTLWGRRQRFARDGETQKYNMAEICNGLATRPPSGDRGGD